MINFIVFKKSVRINPIYRASKKSNKSGKVKKKANSKKKKNSKTRKTANKPSKFSLNDKITRIIIIGTAEVFKNSC